MLKSSVENQYEPSPETTMLTLKKSHQLLIGLVLVALMIATRGHHFASITHLPSASWAVFFLAGVYLSPAWAFVGLLALAGGLDFAAVTWGGVSNFCTSPAYPFLIPAYGSLWLAGRWFAKHYSFGVQALPKLGASLLGGSMLAELFSSGGFYFLSGRYAEPTLAEFGARLVKYYPHALETLAFWMGIAIVVHLAFAFARGEARKQA
jgi:hypothetical protein